MNPIAATLAVFAIGFALGHLDQLGGRWLMRVAKRRRQQVPAA